MVYTSLETVDFDLEDLPTQPLPDKILMTSPEHFEVLYVINPHMKGNVGTVDATRAREEWEQLKATYELLGLDVRVLEGAPGLPDMVFCANQTLPFYAEGAPAGVVLSQMHALERRNEVPRFAEWFQQQGRTVVSLPETVRTSFEGMGDAIWHPGYRLLWGGYGFRTTRDVYAHLARDLDARVVLLELNDPDFYHLDTCFSVLDAHSVLIYPDAFVAEGLDLIGHFFDRIIEAPEGEARRHFACNAYCPDGRHVLIQQGCPRTSEALLKAGFEPVPLETGEFLKSGGSVFCMKLAYW